MLGLNALKGHSGGTTCCGCSYLAEFGFALSLASPTAIFGRLIPPNVPLQIYVTLCPSRAGCIYTCYRVTKEGSQQVKGEDNKKPFGPCNGGVGRVVPAQYGTGRDQAPEPRLHHLRPSFHLGLGLEHRAFVPLREYRRVRCRHLLTSNIRL